MVRFKYKKDIKNSDEIFILISKITKSNRTDLQFLKYFLVE